jgi:hypothetical protein
VPSSHAVAFVLTLTHQRTKVVIWLYDNIEMRIEGRITVRVLLDVLNIMLNLYRHARRPTPYFFLFPVLSSARLRISRAPFPLLFVSSFCRYIANITTTQGFDEFMNVVLDEAAEVYVKEAKPRRELGV